MKASDALMSTSEACGYLGIKPQTLYAYVSRGLLRVERSSDGRGSLYLRSELDALKERSRARSGHGPTAAGAMRWGDPVLDSAITSIQGGELYHRGFAVSALIERGVAFENVAELLWSGDLPAQRRVWALPRAFFVETPAEPRATDAAAQFARRLFHVVGRCARADKEAGDEVLDQTLTRARSLMLLAAEELFGRSGAGGSLADIVAAGRGEAARKAVEAAMIASADHELNASTFAARVAASTGADLYGAVLAGLGAFSGRRHGLAPLDVMEFVERAGDVKEAKAAVVGRLRAKQVLPGFGHRLYPDGDPRARPLIEAARVAVREAGGARGGGSRAGRAAASARDAVQRFAIVEAVLESAESHGAAPPTLDFGLTAVSVALGLPGYGPSALFALGRLAGWTAHVIEQRQQDFLLRPRARYVGRPPVTL